MPAPIANSRTSSVSLPPVAGVSSSIEVSSSFQSTSNRTQRDGVTTFSVETTGTLGVRASGSGQGVRVSIGDAGQVSSRFSLNVPDAAARSLDIAKFNPLDPSKLPLGASLTLDGSKNRQAALDVSFRKLALLTSTTSAENVSLRVDKLSATTVRVTAAPSSVFTRTTKLGLTNGKMSAFITAGESLRGEALKSAVIDLSTTAGKKAYRELLTTGAFPTKTGAGVTASASMERISYEHQNGASVLGRDFWFGNRTAGDAVRTTHADGTVDVSSSLQYAGGVPLRMTRRWDAAGREQTDKRQFEFPLSLTRAQASRLTEITTGQRVSDRSMKEGAHVLKLDDGQLKRLYTAVKQATRAAPGDTQLRLLAESPDHVAFGMALVRVGQTGTDAFIQKLASIRRGADGDWRSEDGALPGTLVSTT